MPNTEIEDAAYIAAAQANYADTSADNILIQQPGVALPDVVVDRISGAAWVMAWVYVSDEDVTLP